MQALTLRVRTALLAALAALSLPARALDFGELEVLSGIGEKLDARIPLKAGPGEWFHVTCLALSGAAADSKLPPLADGVVSVERRSRGANVRLRSAAPVNEPAFAFGITSTCAGSQPTTRQFSALLDPPRVARPPSDRQPPRMGIPRADAQEPRAAVRATPPPPPARVAQEPGSAPEPKTTTPAPQASPPLPPGAGFVLRLTSDPIDTSRSRGFDEKARAVLRERLRLLDSDDQVAAMLALRDNMQRLEARVAELQLKLAAAPATIPPRPTDPPAAPAPAPPSVAAKPEPAPTATPSQKAEASPKTEPAPKAPAATSAPASPAAPAKTAPPPTPRPSDGAEFQPGGLWPWIAGLALLVLLLIAWAWRRRARAATQAIDPPDDHVATTFIEPSADLDEDRPIEVAMPVRTQAAPAVATPAAAAPTEDPAETLRRRYIEERFPEIRNHTIVLDDPGSVVKGARLFYEDGAFPRAVELLRFAIEDRPDAIRPWLALFEIYRLERLTGEYAELAARFRERHGESDKWEKVRAFGREIDPGNPAYQDPPSKSLETIGPREARRLAQSHADPLVENWLEAPMDFENEVLATELRRSLMARAAVEDRDLAPNPMPALRSVEMFSVG